MNEMKEKEHGYKITIPEERDRMVDWPESLQAGRERDMVEKRPL
jgi:hypothetical protein